MTGDIFFILILLLCICVLVFVGIQFTTKATPALRESDVQAICPSRANYTAAGLITSEPGGKLFISLDSYTQYYKYLASMGVECSFVSPSRDESLLAHSAPKATEVLTEDEQTYALTPIKKLDDYEYSRVFQIEKESRNELERTTVNALTSQRQFDWSQLPFNSEHRATNEQDMSGRRLVEGFTDTITEPFFNAIAGDNMAPQDLQDIDEREQAILQQYSPKKTEDLMEHDTDDVQVLVKKLYETDADWEPVVEKVKGGEFQVTKLIPKRKKEDAQFADEQVPSVAYALENGMATGRPKIQPKMEVSGMQDPYFDKTGVLDYEGDRFYRYDSFAKWTPGLERMFAPTFDQNDWIGSTETTSSDMPVPGYTQQEQHQSPFLAGKAGTTVANTPVHKVSVPEAAATQPHLATVPFGK